MTETVDKNLQTVFVAGFKNIFNYKARASKYDYWGFLLANVLVAMLAMVLILGFAFVTPIVSSILLVSYYAYSIVAFFAALSLLVRRLHDTNHSGNILWLMLIFLSLAIIGGALGFSFSYGKIGMSLLVVSLAVFVGISLWVFVISMFKGQKEGNKYGEPVEEPEDYNEKANIFIIVYLLIKLVFGGVNFFLNLASDAKDAWENTDSEVTQNVTEENAADAEVQPETSAEVETPSVPMHGSAE